MIELAQHIAHRFKFCGMAKYVCREQLPEMVIAVLANRKTSSILSKQRKSMIVG